MKLLFWVALLLVGCNEAFRAPSLPDLAKVPYDFAVTVPPYTGGHPRDLGPPRPADLADRD